MPRAEQFDARHRVLSEEIAGRCHARSIQAEDVVAVGSEEAYGHRGRPGDGLSPRAKYFASGLEAVEPDGRRRFAHQGRRLWYLKVVDEHGHNRCEGVDSHIRIARSHERPTVRQAGRRIQLRHRHVRDLYDAAPVQRCESRCQGVAGADL